MSEDKSEIHEVGPTLTEREKTTATPEGLLNAATTVDLDTLREADAADTAAEIRSARTELDEIKAETIQSDTKPHPTHVLSQAPENSSPSFLRRFSSSLIERSSGLVYSFLGERTPNAIQTHVPVYRTVEKQYAGMPNTVGESQWTIGTGSGKRHAMGQGSHV